MPTNHTNSGREKNRRGAEGRFSADLCVLCAFALYPLFIRVIRWPNRPQTIWQSPKKGATTLSVSSVVRIMLQPLY
jgi:hypothetical protein